MAALSGLGVLVTRPAAQADGLCAALGQLGATVLRLPALDIVPAAAPAALRAAAGPLDRYRWVIFVSANAVLHGASLLAALPAQGGPGLLAVGPATAAALAAAGHPVVRPPDGAYDSESLLAGPTLRDVNGAQVLIVRGEGGREHLAESLAARGARVDHAAVYRRELPATTSLLVEQVARAETALARGELQVITATSGELFDNTLRLLTDHSALRRVAWLAGSRRIGDRIREVGFSGDLIVAERPDDAGLVDALVFWRRHTAGHEHA